MRHALLVTVGKSAARFAASWLVLALAPWLGSCRTSSADVGHKSPPHPAELRATETTPAHPEPTRSDHCEQLWGKLLKTPELPGAPTFERLRSTLLARAKAEPVLFLDTPRFAPASSPTVTSYREHLRNTIHHWDALSFELERFRGRPDIGRQVLLRDGYLYSEHPHMAYAMDQQVKPEHLFDADRIWIQRGDRVLHARRAIDGSYVYEDSGDPPQPVSLLYLDRLGVGTPAAPLHVDVRGLRERLHFDRFEPVRATADGLLAELRYEDQTVRTVLHADGARLDVRCEWPEGDRKALERARSQTLVRHRAVRRLQAAMHEQVVDALPFDEPKNEVGNQDGSLRARWLRAYGAGKSSFRREGETYSVFNRFGHARPPQVCVDFITDTLERSAGTWFAPRDRQPGREIGALDLSRFEALDLRRVPNLIRFAESRPDWFDVVTTDPRERIALGRRERFFAAVERTPDFYRAGDILIVRGVTAADSEHLHYHSFFIYETDPVSGVPIAIVGNSGYPHVWSLEDESRRAPERSIWHRIRLRPALLEKIASASSELPNAPALLVEEELGPP